MDEGRCYAWQTPEARPSKRRRIQSSELTDRQAFRQETYHELWARQEKRILIVLDESVEKAVDDIARFCIIEDAIDDERIPAGLIIAGPSIASQDRFFEKLGQTVVDGAKAVFIPLSSDECPNLKTLLKALIQKGTDADNGEDGPSTTRRKGPKLLDFDLQILHEWVVKEEMQHVVVALEDSEAFDGSLLGELIELLSVWSARISFRLLFGIATSAEGFQDKLPSAALRCLACEHFDIKQADELLEQVFECILRPDPEVVLFSDGTNYRNAVLINPDEEEYKYQYLFIGPVLSGRLLEQQRDHIQSIDTFVRGVKYAFMSHFYANILSIFLHPGLKFEDVTKVEFEALRNLPSFRRRAEELLEQRETKLLRKLLRSDQDLFIYCLSELRLSFIKFHAAVDAADDVFMLRSYFPKVAAIPKSALYISALSGGFHESPNVRELLLSIKKAPSDVFTQLMEALDANHELHQRWHWIALLQKQLENLLKEQGEGAPPLRSQHDVRNDTFRTTVVAQKVGLSKSKSSLSETDAKYSKLVEEFHDGIKREFDMSFGSMDDLFLREIFIYDLKSPHSEVFTPRPRYAIERALSAPHDYLNCTCCAPKDDLNNGEQNLSATQPATAILYQLYLESGSLVNVSDLWSAFNAIIGGEKDSHGHSMALFQRALAELRYLGLIRTSRKKTDHIAKVAWFGL